MYSESQNIGIKGNIMIIIMPSKPLSYVRINILCIVIQKKADAKNTLHIYAVIKSTQYKTHAIVNEPLFPLHTIVSAGRTFYF